MTNGKVKVTVRFKKEAGIRADAVTSLGGTIEHTLTSINAIKITIDKDKVEELKKHANVLYVIEEPTEKMHVLGFKGDLKVEGITKTLQSSQQVPWGITKIRADVVQENGNKGSGIKVCILDTGMDYNHEDLVGQMKLGYNFVTKTNDPMDGYGHGTHVAGTIAALDNDIGVIGVAPECSLLIGKVLDDSGSGGYDIIVQGIDWAINNGAQVISMSFGGSLPYQPLEDALNAAKNAGIVLVAATGNSDGDGSSDTVGYPAKYASCMAIAATDVSDNRASFSSCGTEVWVAAPGVSVLSTVPKSGPLGDPSGYKYLSGTSMATPHVSGTVALMLKANPNLSPDNVKTLFSTTSINLGTGVPNVFFGYGRIDALNAVGGSPPPTPVLASITIPVSVSVQVGQTTTLTASCKDTSGRTMTCPTLTWTSDNTGIATVSNGVVTGVAAGSANITASNSDASIVSNKCVVTVTAAPPPPSKHKYMVIPTGIGAVVLINPLGSLTADQACTAVCDIIHKIDQK